ncbi:MAG TPA: hypothetical protein VFT30_07205, partial [Nitrospira sp.]|nr:hypothetical protein [Nitrospira sp.]
MIRTRSSVGAGFLKTRPSFLVLKQFLFCLRTPSLILCLSLLGAPSTWAQVTTDEYIAGFATAVLQHEFKAADSTLQVHDGVIRISARSLGGLDREKVKRSLTDIAGVKEVVIEEDEELAASPTPQRGVLVDVPETESSFLPR